MTANAIPAMSKWRALLLLARLARRGAGARRSRSPSATASGSAPAARRSARPRRRSPIPPSPPCSIAATRSSAATPPCRSAGSTCCGPPQPIRLVRLAEARDRRMQCDAAAPAALAGLGAGDAGKLPPRRRRGRLPRLRLSRSAARFTWPKGWRATTAPCGSASGASSPIARCRARSRSQPPAPAIPPPSPAPRPARSIPSALWPRPIAATMPAATPNSSEYFAVLTARDGSDARRAEALVNEALQKSNLGRFGEAETLFASAQTLAGADPVTARRLRNYRAMHLLNQGKAGDALAELARPMPAVAASGAVRDLVIDQRTASRLSGESPGASRLRGPEGLTADDKAQILDGQALQLAARCCICRAATPRRRRRSNGRSASWSRSAAAGSPRRSGCAPRSRASCAELAEARGDRAEAERAAPGRDRAARDNPIRAPPPCSAPRRGSPASSPAPARRRRRSRSTARSWPRAPPAAMPIRRCAACSSPISNCSPMRGADPAAAASLFAASQVLVRPGVAQTQAMLARELSGGSDDAARLFRQSVNLTRDIERGRVELARLEASDHAERGRHGAHRRIAHRARRVAAGSGGEPGAARRTSRATGRCRAARSRSPISSSCSGPARPITR